MADRYDIALKEIPPLPHPTNIEEMEEEIKVRKTTKKSRSLGLQSPSGLIIWIPVEKVEATYATTARELTIKITGAVASSLFSDLIQAKKESKNG